MKVHKMIINKLRWITGTILLGSVLVFGMANIFADNKNNGYNNKNHKYVVVEQDQTYVKECGACHLAYPVGLLPTASWKIIMAGLDDHFGENAELDNETTAYLVNYLVSYLSQPQSAISGSKINKMRKSAPITTDLAADLTTASSSDQQVFESWDDILLKLRGHINEKGELDAEAVAIIIAYLDKPITIKARSKNHKLLNNRSKEPLIRITELPYFIHKHDEIPKRMVADNPQVGSFSQCDSCHKEAVKGLFNEDRVVIPGFGRWDD